MLTKSQYLVWSPLLYMIDCRRSLVDMMMCEIIIMRHWNVVPLPVLCYLSLLLRLVRDLSECWFFGLCRSWWCNMTQLFSIGFKHSMFDKSRKKSNILWLKKILCIISVLQTNSIIHAWLTFRSMNLWNNWHVD